jgi:5-formyltetrahydrofolate cyclo-ligase
MDFTLKKKALRDCISQRIAALPDDYVAESDEGILQMIKSLKEFVSARNIMIYHSVKREPATLGIAAAALASGKTVAFPYCYRGGIMQARVVSSLDELQPAMLGIPAPPDTAPAIPPEELDLIFVPALTFDEAGYRLGYGGGYYDRYLNGIPAFTTGLGRDKLLMDELPRDRHDIAVKCIITESQVLRT